MFLLGTKRMGPNIQRMGAQCGLGKLGEQEAGRAGSPPQEGKYWPDREGKWPSTCGTKSLKVPVCRQRKMCRMLGSHQKMPRREPPDSSVVVVVESLSHVRLLRTPWTVACRTLLSWVFQGKDTGVVVISSPGSSGPRVQTASSFISCTVGRFFHYLSTKESPLPNNVKSNRRAWGK